MNKMNKELNELIEMIKKDRNYYEEMKSYVIANDMSDMMLMYYSTLLMYIDSVIARAKEDK